MNTCGRGLALSLAAMLVASAALAQEAERKTPKAECDNCISKVLYLPNFSTSYELQDVVNMFRIIAELSEIYPKQSEHTIALKGTQEQLVITDKLVSVLEDIRASGGDKRSSVLVYESKGRLSGTSEGEKFLVQHPQAATTTCELNVCVIKAFYLPDFSNNQLYDLVNKVRTTTQMTRTFPSTPRHLLVVRGTPEQVAMAEKLANE